MLHKQLITSTLGLILMGLTATVSAQGLGPTGPSTPSPVVNGGIYQWPEVQSPCPEVQIKQKHDHVPLPQYQAMHWDTAVTCRERQITLSAMPYIPVQFTNGYYYVDEIPYNPPDTSFWMNGQGIQQDINSDDRFAPTSVQLDFPFYFFGVRKTQFRISDNGHVTFTNNFSSDSPYTPLGCPFSFSSGIPWTSANTPTYSGDCFNRMHDAIYGVYEDTFTGRNGSYMSGHQGIYYGVVDEWPCRKIIATWNEIPVYDNSNQRHSYQIVCYEGSNIIEVHIKSRTFKPSTSNGIIGIQNATGQPQVKSSDPESPLYWISQGAPAAFYPTGYNPISGVQNITRKAFRFTPFGETVFADGWYRILPDRNGADSAVQLTTNPSDTNGYYIPANPSSSAPTLTRAVVEPTTVSRYYYHMRFQNANGDWYRLYDTITIGVDTVNNLTITPAQQDICLGSSVAPTLEFLSIQDTELVNWYVTRVSNGQQVPLSSSTLHMGQINDDGTHKTMSISVNSNNLPQDGVGRNRIDTLIIESSIDFVSGCHNSASTMIRIFPNFDTIIRDGICKGEEYHWRDDGNVYTQTTRPPYPSVTLQSQPGCDSIVKLDLTVYDVSHTVVPIVDCLPVTWINGKTYTQSNTATFAQDTVVLPNRYGCDSIVQLDLQIYPLTARLQASLTHFDYDHLDVELTDISTNGGERIWQITGAPDQTTPAVYYTIPIEMDSAEIMLIESSPYGCIDTATLTIPFHKESFWLPNAFTPDNPAGNNLFGSTSIQTLQQEMLIYNRFGELVFRCDQPDCQWDGRNLDGTPCTQGAYVYIIRYTTTYEPNRTNIRKGTVTLLR